MSRKSCTVIIDVSLQCNRMQCYCIVGRAPCNVEIYDVKMFARRQIYHGALTLSSIVAFAFAVAFAVAVAVAVTFAVTVSVAVAAAFDTAFAKLKKKLFFTWHRGRGTKAEGLSNFDHISCTRSDILVRSHVSYINLT